KLNDTEGMLLLHLLSFKQLEQNEFPTIEQLQERLGATSSAVGQALQKLMKLGFVAIDEVFDPVSGVQSEKYNLAGLFIKIGALLASGEPSSAAAPETYAGARETASAKSASVPAPAAAVPRSLFALFEQEFGRPLSPMEYETINGWLDQDRYAD